MSERAYDVVIVGARCAGASLATLLARAGARVLLLDKDAMPSDHVLSTHSINPPGMDVLDELGVGALVRAITPPSSRLRLSVEGDTVDVRLPSERPTYCPRRHRLDGLLQQAAVEAGAEFVDCARVAGLVHDGARVRGVHVTIDGRERTFAAGLVVGADGRHSSIARDVAAGEYLGYDAPRASYWGYWDAATGAAPGAARPFDVYFSVIDNVIRSVFQTDDNQLLIGSSIPVEDSAPWRADPQRSLRSSLDADPVTADLIVGSDPVGHVRGAVKERFYFREATGPGWALVGDAGHHKEFLLGDGITEALLQARGLAAAIARGADAALERWWRARDVEALPLFFVGQVAGAVDRPVELQRILFSRVARQPDFHARMIAVIDRRMSPFAALPARDFLPWVVADAMRGRWRAMGEMLGMGRQALGMAREIGARTRLLKVA